MARKSIARKNPGTSKTDLIRSNKVGALPNPLLFSIAHVLIEDVSLQLEPVSKSKSKRKKPVTEDLEERESGSSGIEQELPAKGPHTLLQRVRLANRTVTQSTSPGTFFLYNDTQKRPALF